MSTVKFQTPRASSAGITQSALGETSSPKPAAPGAAAEPGDASATDAFQEQGQGPSAGPFSSAADAGTFNADLPAAAVEQLGNLHAAVHVVKLTHHWSKQGATSEQAAQRAAALLASFTRPDVARAVARELDRMPIYGVYPLQVHMALMDLAPDILPGWVKHPVVQNRGALSEGGRVLVGHTAQVRVPSTVKVTALALLGNAQPGYQFEPLRTGVFQLLMDTPGTYTFALRASAPGNATWVDTFVVDVREPGKRPPKKT